MCSVSLRNGTGEVEFELSVDGPTVAEPQGFAGRGASVHLHGGWRSDRYDAEGWIQSPKIIRIGCDDLLTSAASADHNMSIHHI
jgi:hypothetical protein